VIISSEHVALTQRAQPSHALAGRAGLRDGQLTEQPQLGWMGRWGIPSTSLKGYHMPARAEPDDARTGFHRGLPPGWHVVGLSQVDGMPHGSQRARSVIMRR
jgi:hypothetical protein